MNKTDTYTIDKPKNFTYKNVMFWEPKSQELLRLRIDGQTEAATLLSKAKHFLRDNCIERFSDKFICKPIKGYNKTIYMIEKTGFGFTCNCQGFANNKFCSHILAVQQFIFINAPSQ